MSGARRVIENAFGILASRWRIYRSPLLCSVKTTEALIKASVCLHNYLRSESPNVYTPPAFIDSLMDNGYELDGEWRTFTKNDSHLTSIGRVGSNVAANYVIELRDQLADYLISDAGAVQWQLTYANRGKF